MTSELEQDGALPPQAMLTVAAVARRLGVAPSTLRTWDRRYGLGPSAHTAGSHRRYSPADVSRLVVMRGLVMEGVPPAEAAQIALGSPVEGGSQEPFRPLSPPQPPPAPAGDGTDEPPAGPAASRPSEFRAVLPPNPSPLTGVPASRAMPYPEGLPAKSGSVMWPVAPLVAQHLPGGPSHADAAPERALPRPDEALDDVLAQALGEAMGTPARSSPVPGWTSPPGARAGGGRVISLPDASPRTRGLARAAMSLDTHELSRLLRDAVGAYGVVGTWNSMVLPVLHGLGERWQSTGEGVDVEHAFAEATAGVLRGVTATLYRPRNVRPVLLACADGDYHSLPIHVLAAALAELEVGCRLLGVGLPASDLIAATRRTGPAVVFIYARLPVSDGGWLPDFARQRPAPRVLVGGPGWEYVCVPGSVVRVDSLQGAVDEVLATVRLA